MCIEKHRNYLTIEEYKQNYIEFQNVEKYENRSTTDIGIWLGPNTSID